MNVIVCIDDDNGMMFNHRRQSQDRVLRDKVLQDINGAKLWMNQYSYQMFSDMECSNIIIDECFLEKAEPGDYCFLENISPAIYENKIESLIIFKWNRRYPSDVQFDIPIKEHDWKLEMSEEFVGSSHEKITREVYSR